MKTLRFAIACVVVVLCLGAIGAAQSIPDPAAYASFPGWTYGLFAIGGSGLQQDSDIQTFGAGARLGRVLTHEHGHGFLKGTLEWNAEVLPLYQFYGRGETATGAVINPLLLKWNFTRGLKASPFFEVIGGTILTNKDFPPGDTSNINFNSGAGVGINVFVRDRRSISFDVRALHISNASIGNHNPGVNASLQFTIGYTWWKNRIEIQ